jgi:hypothetical protein
MSDHERYARMLARVAAERQGRSLTLRLAETNDPGNPYIVAKRLALQRPGRLSGSRQATVD